MADVQPVLDALAERTAKLFGVINSSIWMPHGDVLRRVALSGARPGAAMSMEVPIRRTAINGRAFVDRKTLHIPDVVPLLDSQYPDAKVNHRKTGFRSVLSVPMLREGKAIGVLSVWRLAVQPFTPQEIALLESFATQAVIAIENARLFNETKEALEHQKASADVLKIVASSVESTDPVFRAITEAGMRLVPGCRVAMHLVRDGQLHFVSQSGASAEHRKKIARFYPMPVKGGTFAASKAVAEKRIVHIPDIEKAGREFPQGLKISRASGWRAIVSVPLMRGEEAIGNIAITRSRRIE
jgi:GAF domain-containing protein